MPKICRPTCWDGYAVVDVLEAARRLGVSGNAVRMLIKHGVLKKQERKDRRVMIEVVELEAFMCRQELSNPTPLMLLSAV